MDYNILRENDIRGAYPSQINKDSVIIIAKAFAVYLNNINIDTCLIGYDNRLSSKELYIEIKKNLINSGINVVSIGEVTTPIFNYASIKNNIPYGLMITASHNKKTDNGIKIFGENFLHLKQNELKKLYGLIKEEAFISGLGSFKEINMTDDYIDMLINKFKPINKKVVVDCGNGTASLVIKKIFSKIFVDVSYLNCESDGSFPIHNPDPNVESNLVLLKNIVKLKNADLGIAVDGDCDRIGIVDEKGNTITTDYLIIIFAKDIILNNENKNIIIDVKCSKATINEINKMGGNPVMVKNGSAYIEGVVSDFPALLGGEFSGHIFFRDDYYGYDDGIYAGLRTAKILDEKNVLCSELINNMEKFYSTEEIRINVADDIKFSLVEYIKDYALKKEYNCNLCDGVRVDYEDGFSLVRASNTGPCVTLRFEAKTEEKLEERQKEFIELIDEYLRKKM